LQQGKAFKSEIADVIRRFKEDLQKSRQQAPDSLIAGFLQATDFIPIQEDYFD